MAHFCTSHCHCDSRTACVGLNIRDADWKQFSGKCSKSAVSQCWLDLQDLPSSGEYINSLDQDMLLLKATSNATMACLEQCLSILQQQQVRTLTQKVYKLELSFRLVCGSIK